MAATPGSVGGGGIGWGKAALIVAQVAVSYLSTMFTNRDGPRLSDLTAANGDYGGALPRLFGPEVRVGGLFLAQAAIKETRHTVHKGEALNIAVGAVSGALTGFELGGPVGAAIGFVAGGLLSAAAPKQHYYTYSDTFALLLADRSKDGPIEGVTKIWAAGRVIFTSAESTPVAQLLDAEGRLIWRKYGQNRYFKSLTIYGGGRDQVADPILVAALGKPQCGYRGRAIAVIEDLQLADFGQSLPAPIEGLVVAKTAETLASVAETICREAGIDVEHSLSSVLLAGVNVRGYAITSETNCWDGLKPLLPAFRVDLADVSGQLRFYQRDQGLRATIPVLDMGAHAFGDEQPEAIRFTRAPAIDLPKATSVSFIDPARDYAVNTATSQRSEGKAQSNISVNLPLTLSAGEGATAAATIHWDAWLGRATAGFNVTDQWISVAPGVAYALPVKNQFLPFRIRRRTRGANGIIEIEATSDESVTFRGVVDGSSGTVPDSSSTVMPETIVVPINMPITSDYDDDFGFYVAVAGSQDYWVSGLIQISADGTSFGTVGYAEASAILGNVSGVLTAGPTTGLDDALDTVNSLTVVLEHDGMSLSSATDADLDGLANFAFVGKDGLGEYLQFKTATKLAPRTWELTGLRRGRKGTDFALGLHSAGEQFVLMGEGGVYRVNATNGSLWGTPLLLRGVTLNQDEASAELINFTNTGEGKRPPSPVNIVGNWDGAYNLAATFQRRSRFFSGIIGTDAPESFEADIFGPDGHTVIRTLTSATETFTYSAANAAADGLLAGGITKGKLYQVNPDRGRGHPRAFTLIGPLGIRADGTLVTADSTAITADYTL